MQRIAREAAASSPGQRTAVERYALLEQHCSTLITDTYAVPRMGRDDVVEWWSKRGGQPVPYGQLGASQQSTLLDTYRQRLADVKQTADALAARGDTQTAADLQKFLVDKPDLNTLYSIDQTPVLTNWDTQSPSPVVVPPAPVAAAVPLAATPHRARWPWLLAAALLLLLLAALIWWWFFNKKPEPAIPTAPAVVAAPPAAEPPVVAPPPEPAPPEPVPPPPPAAKPVPAKAPEPACEPLPKDQPGPEFVVVLDTSGSMRVNIASSREDELWYFRLTENQVNNLQGQDLARAERIMQEPSRYQVAVNAMGKMLESLPPSIDTGLITYAGCKNPVKQGVFSASQRPALMSALRALTPFDGTPVADSLRLAADMVDGVDRDAVIVMFVDGEDGCEQNQCAVAREIAKKKPRLKVNIVDLTGANLSSCIAKSTGGKVFSSQDIKAIPVLLQKASSQALKDRMCKPVKTP
ncbi:VWA domain-containing protein [Achromobacter marplatensis]|jgi:hypothetical protein|uniref:VWA domain-containing protein n=1 Tax=Achromobacter marplatensis TaxID=470868 RepID=UPI003CFFF8A6